MGVVIRQMRRGGRSRREQGEEQEREKEKERETLVMTLTKLSHLISDNSADFAKRAALISIRNNSPSFG